MPSSTALYEAVVAVTVHYLGPAAERFVERQIQQHLRKKPQTITRQDLGELIDWISMATVLLTEDTDTVDEYTMRLRELAKPPRRQGA